MKTSHIFTFQTFDMNDEKVFYQHECKVLSVQFQENLISFLDENNNIFLYEKNKFNKQKTIDNAIYFINATYMEEKLSDILLKTTQLLDRNVFFIGCLNGDVFSTTLKEKTIYDKNFIINIGEKVIHIINMKSKVVIIGENSSIYILNIEDGEYSISEYKISKNIKNIIQIKGYIIFNTLKGSVYLLDPNPLSNFLKFAKIPNFQDISMISTCTNETFLAYNQRMGSIHLCTIPTFEMINEWNEKMIKTEKIQKKIRKRIQEIDEISSEQIEIMKKMNQMNTDLTTLNKIHQIELEEKNITCLINEKITHEGKIKIIIQNNSKHLIRNWKVTIKIQQYKESDEIIQFKIPFLKPSNQWDTEQPIQLKGYKKNHIIVSLDYPFENGTYSIKILEKDMNFFQLLEYCSKDTSIYNDQYIYTMKLKLKDDHPLKDFTNLTYYTFLDDPIHLKFFNNIVTFSSHVYPALIWLRSYLLPFSIPSDIPKDDFEKLKKNFKDEMIIFNDKLKQLDTLEKKVKESNMKYDLEKFEKDRIDLKFEIYKFHEKYRKLLNNY